MLATILASILSNIFTILIPISVGKYYELVFEFNAKRSQIFNFLPFDIGENMTTFLIFFFVLIAFKTLFLFIEKYTIGVLGEQLSYSIRNQLFEQQLYLPSLIYDQKGIGKYLLRFSGDLKSIQNYLTNGIIRFTSDVLLMLLALSSLIYLNYQLGIIVSVVLFFTSLIILLFNKQLSIITRKRRNTKSMLLSFVNLRLRAIHSINAFNKENPEKNKFFKRSQKVYFWGIKYQVITAVIKTIIPASMYLMLALVLLTSYYLKQQAVEVGGGILLIFIMLLISLLPIFRRLLKVNIVWELGNISFEKLLKIFNQSTKNHTAKKDFLLDIGNIQFKQLNFSYNNNTPILHQLNWHLPSRQIHLIQGASGSGKGTLVKLLNLMYSPTNGNIYIDEQCLKTVNPKSLRKHLAIVSNNFPLLGKTVFEAISYSRHASKRVKAQAILNQLQQHLLPANRLTLNQKIGDLGIHLSKGEAKLLLYARALLTNKKILIIDEPFQDLDANVIPNIAQIINQQKIKKNIVILSNQKQFPLLNIDQFITLPTSIFVAIR